MTPPLDLSRRQFLAAASAAAGAAQWVIGNREVNSATVGGALLSVSIRTERGIGSVTM